MKRKIFALLLILAAVLSLSSCKNEEKQEEPPKKEEEIPFEFEEEEIEIIYAKTPEEASDKCMDAIYTGDLSGAKQYVLEDGNAKTEINKFREGIKKSFEKIAPGASAEKIDRLFKNAFSRTDCKRTGTTKEGDRATVSYLISVPDMGSINFSAYMDEYIASLGMGPEEFMTFLESMSAEESQKWSMELGVDVLNYVFEKGGAFSKSESRAEVVVENRKNGWIVTEIKIL